MAESELFHGRVGSGNQWMYLKKNAAQEDAILQASTEKYLKAVRLKEKEIITSQERIANLRNKHDKASQTLLKEEERRLKDLYKQKRDAEVVLQSEKNKIRSAASRAAEIFEQNRYKQLSQREKMLYQKDVSDKLKTELKFLQDRYDAYEAEQQRLRNIQRSSTATEAEKEEARLKSEEIENQKTQVSSDISKTSSEIEKTDNLIDTLFNYVSTKAEKATKAAEEYAEAEALRQQSAAEAESALREYEEALKDPSATDAQKKALEEVKNAKLAEAQASEEAAKTALEHKKAALEEAESVKTLEEAEKEAAEEEAERKKQQAAQLSAVANKVINSISGYLGDMYGSQSRMIGRLQGSDVDWKKSILGVTTTVGVSGVVSQKNIVAKMVELVDSGVAYNLEMRAFLAETSQNIASTFDAANGTLLRMIRLQQADTTAARLGMEASLTKLFNEYFSDTSYLTDSGPADNITTAILDASATMSKDDSLQFEFNVQKWLGSLYSLGMSSEAVEKVAKGLNYLGTGDYAALANDTSLQTIFALSASRSGGKSYDQLLKTGLNGEETNKLLRSMIEYLAEIANSQTDYVTRSAYANLFGMSVTDLTAFASLTSKEIENIYNRRTSYQKLFEETQTQLEDVVSRLSVAQLVDTVIENAQIGAASLIGSNAVTYGMWKSLAVLKDYVGKIPVPGILVGGFGITSETDLLNVAQTAMAGMGLIGSLVSGIGSMLNGGATNLDNWDFKPETSRGGGLRLLDLGSMSTTSYSETLGVGGATGDIVSDVSMESAKSTAMQEGGVTSEELAEGKEIPAKIYDALAGEETPTVISLLQHLDDTLANTTTPNILSLLHSIESISGNIEDRLDPGRVFYTAIAGVLSRTAVSEITNLSTQLSAKGIASSFEEEKHSFELPSTPAAVLKDSLTGISMLSDESNGLSLETIISNAVEQAIRNISYSLGTGIPVNITNLPIV